MLRNNLKADTLYFDANTEGYFYTPNVPGVIWLSPIEADLMFDEEASVVYLEVV